MTSVRQRAQISDRLPFDLNAIKHNQNTGVERNTHDLKEVVKGYTNGISLNLWRFRLTPTPEKQLFAHRTSDGRNFENRFYYTN